MEIKRRDIILVSLDPVIGSEQGKTRPALVVQNDVGNKFSPTIIVAPLTSEIFSKVYPINVYVEKKYTGLDQDSTILLGQIRTIDKKRIIRKLGSLDKELMIKVDKAIMVSLDL